MKTCCRSLVAVRGGLFRTPEVVPEGLLDRERFKEVLLEAQLIEARMNQELVVSARDLIPAEHYYAEMFARARHHEASSSNAHSNTIAEQTGGTEADLRGDLRRIERAQGRACLSEALFAK